MSVENFFPAHYPWQRLLSDIRGKLVPEESEDDTMVVEVVFGTDAEENMTLELQITAGELFEAMKTKHVVAISFVEEYSQINMFPLYRGVIGFEPAGYSFYGFDFYDGDTYMFSASTASDKPLYTDLSS